ncbi:MAG: hypothetical protein Tsb006_8120 [Rickettsiaceae bacterium]
MTKRHKRYLYFLVFIIFAIIGIRSLELNKNEKFLNFLAHYYFDKNYYLENYPDIKAANVDPFDHYVKYGWKEGRNPSESFDTNFYIKCYLSSSAANAYNLNPLADYIKSRITFKRRFISMEQFTLGHKVKLLDNPKYYISLVALFQNEARFLKEWIEFHLLMGVEHFYLYNNLSTDNYMEVLEPYIKKGVVELRNLNARSDNLEEWNIVQTNLYTSFAKEVQDITEWLVVIDTDEFLFPVKARKLQEVFKKYDNYPSLSVNWKLFGSGDVERIESGKLMIESLTLSSDKKDMHVKTIVKPRYVKYFDNPHFAHLILGYGQVTENFIPFDGLFSPTASLNILRINHYWARDWAFFRENKLSRVHVISSALDEEEKKAKIESMINVNKAISAEYDGSILRFVSDLKERMGQSD